ncbi:TPA: hypothetical protein ACPOY2_001709 [Haemophilus influenzae]
MEFPASCTTSAENHPQQSSGNRKSLFNEVNGISRVVYDISGKPPATIEWE